MQDGQKAWTLDKTNKQKQILNFNHTQIFIEIPWKSSSASLLSFVRWLAFMHNWRVTAWKEWQKSLDSFGLAEAHSFSNTESKKVQI